MTRPLPSSVPVLQEDPSYSYRHPQLDIHDSLHNWKSADSQSDNRIIFGDNLPVLQALLPEFTETIKCIYIDPPYNTGNAFPHYPDGLDHKNWLDFMKPRLSVLWSLLRNDGLLAVQIDDHEFARLYLFLAELCQEHNLKVICVKMAEPTGVKMAQVLKHGGIPKLKEYIILAGKSGVRGLRMERVAKGSWDREYRLVVSHVTYTDLQQLKAIIANPDRTRADVQQANAICARFVFEPYEVVYQREARAATPPDTWRYDNAWRIVRTCSTSASAKHIADTHQNSHPVHTGAFSIETPQHKLYVIKADYNKDHDQPRMRLLFADDYLSVHPGDFWSDMKTTGLGDEGGVDFTQGKKPEVLMKRIIGMVTRPGEWVLDAFAGSGTAGAVAHKMGRRWLLIEHGPQCHSHILPRLRRVVDGTDQSGISKAMHWQGGGGFRYFCLKT